MNTRKRPPMPASKDWPAQFHLTADLIALTITDGVLQVAVVQRDSKLSCIDINRDGDVQEIKRQPNHHWALPGGHVQFDQEDVDEAAVRELLEETNIRVDRSSLIQIGTYGNLGRDPRPGRTVSVAYLAFQPMFSNPIAGSDAKKARFIPVLKLLTDPNRLEFDHEAMLIDGIQRVRDLVLTTPVATSFCPPEFTMSELREVYDVLWDRAYDKEISSDERHMLTAEIPEYIGSENLQFLSTTETASDQGLASRSSQSPWLSSGAFYDRLTYEIPEIKYKLSGMSDQSLKKISQILIYKTKRSSPKKPKTERGLNPANFSNKVASIPGFIEKIPNSKNRSSMASTGRLAQLYRRGQVERLEPPLRLTVKRNKKTDDS